MSYIQVAEDENEDAIELPLEEDNTMLLSTLTSQFPGSSGLKYKNPETGTARGIRLKVVPGEDARLQPPEKGWEEVSVYYVVGPKGENKRSSEDPTDGGTPTKMRKSDSLIRGQNKCSDLIVLGLPWKTTEAELKEYFETFGKVVMTQVKKDPRTGMSKGFGFVRFESYDIQRKAIAERHNIGGRWCDVRIPVSRGDGAYLNQEFNRKIFVGRLAEDITTDDLREYFSKYGEIVDVFIPKPFRAFAFVTFADSDVAQALCGEDHIIKSGGGSSSSVHVSSAVPKVAMNNMRGGFGGSGPRGGGGPRGSGGYGRFNQGRDYHGSDHFASSYEEERPPGPQYNSYGPQGYQSGNGAGYGSSHPPEVWSTHTDVRGPQGMPGGQRGYSTPAAVSTYPMGGPDVNPSTLQLAAALGQNLFNHLSVSSTYVRPSQGVGWGGANGDGDPMMRGGDKRNGPNANPNLRTP